MYSESASLEFFDSVQQSERLAFLAELARALEAAVGLDTKNPGFSIDVRANGKVDVVIWHAWKRRALWSQVQAGHGRELFRVVRPKEFAEFGGPGKKVEGDV
jgi:hypothetical protein